MAQFNPCVRGRRSDGLYTVYIRLSHKSKTQYIKTNLVVSDKGLKKVYSKSGKMSYEIADRFVSRECMILIDDYVKRCNSINISLLSSRELADVLTKDKNISFTSYVKKFTDLMFNESRNKTAYNYIVAYRHLKRFLGVDEIFFEDLTSKRLRAWIESMPRLSRMSNAYPTHIKTLISSAMREMNDYECDDIVIKFNPFERVDIPRSKRPDKRSIEVEELKTFFSLDTTSESSTSIISLSRDVCMLIFCLAGINAADLYDMNRSCLGDDWVLRYNRKKTRSRSDYGAYMEIRVPELIRPLFEKYKDDSHVFNFHQRYSLDISFVRAINKGCKRISQEAGINRDITTYVFRHSWATIAQNECGASTELVAFSLNHSSAHKITEGYIKKSYEPINVLNKKVIDKIFNSDTLVC